MAKVIKDFSINLGSMAAAEVVRNFSVIGDNGAIFSLEVKNEDNKYYNFSTNTFTTAYARLKNKRIDSHAYKGFIIFPTVTDDDQYDIYLYAESMHDTIHAPYSEVRFGDGNLDINSSAGSNSNVLQKVIYQYDDAVITLSAIGTIASLQSTGGFVGMSASSDSITVGRGNSSGKTAFSIAVTAATDKSLQIARQPTIDDLIANTAVTIGSGVQIEGEDIWAGTVRSADLVVNVSGGTSADDTPPNVTMDDDVSVTRWRVGDRITGNAALDAKTGDSAITVSAIDVGSNAKVFTMSEGIVIDDNEELTFTPPYYYRWSTHSGSSIHTLLPSMRMFTADALILENIISSYEDTTTYTTEIQSEDGSIEETTNTVTNVSILALDPLGFKPVITNGLVSQQRGNITFANQVKGDFAGVGARFIAYGSDAIKAIHDTEITITDLKVELKEITTTTTAAVNNSTTIPVAERKGTVANISTINGIGVDTSASRSTDTVDGAVSSVTLIEMDSLVASKMKVNDRVTGTGIPSSSIVTVEELDPNGDNTKEFSVSEKVFIDDGVTLTFTPHVLPAITSATDEDAGNWTASTAQTLESGITLTVGGTGKTAIITGNIEFVNVDDTSFTLYFDVEKFLTAS